MEEKKAKTQEIIETMINTIKLSVPLKVSSDFGKNWYEAK